MLSKCCTQYISKFGESSSSHRTGKCHSSSQFPRVALKNVQITGQLHSYPMLIRLCSKSSKTGFSTTWTKNFQMFKLGLEKAEEPEIKLPTFAGWQRKQGNSRKTSTSVSLATLKPLAVWITTNWKILKETGIPDHPTCCLRNPHMGQETTVRTGHGTTAWFQIGKGERQSCILSLCLFNLRCRVHHEKRSTGRNTSWNQDCWEKYQ